MRQIVTDDDMREGLAYLAEVDPRLVAVQAVAGPVAIRYRPPGFEGLARIVVAQQLSVASAGAIWGRLETLLADVTAARFLAHEAAELRACGLSAGKLKTLTAVAEAAAQGLDLMALAEATPEEAVAQLTALPGIGPWTAEIFLLFCARNADIFPAGDLALQLAVQQGLGLAGRPSEKQLRQQAQAWSPWRGVAAKLWWAYYSAIKAGRNALPA